MKIEKILQNCGLTEKQAKVYLACLELGSSSVQKIAVKSGLARSTVYEVLEMLRKKGFISTFMKKRVKYFSAEDPEQIARFAQLKASALRDVLPELNALAGKQRGRPTVRFYQGKEEMKKILEEVLEEADRLVSFGSAEDMFREIGDYFSIFVEKRIKKKIYARVVLRNSKKAEERKRLAPKQLRKVKILPSKYNYHGVIFIWRNKIAMFSLTNDFTAIVIQSKELAEVQRAMFNYLWDLAE